MRLSGVRQTRGAARSLWHSGHGGTRSQAGWKPAGRDLGWQWHRDTGARAVSNATARRMTQLAIGVLLIEDHFLARMALRSVLSGHSDIEIVGEASDAAGGIEMYRECTPDVTVMDLRMPGMNGFDAIAAIRKLCRTAKIVVLSNYEGSEDIYRAIRNGAMAYLTKNTSGDELVEAIVAVHRGMRYLPPVARDRLAERTSLVELTPREHEVLTCITRGQSNRDIAQQLGIAEKTVRIHVSSVLDKMGVRDRTQAAICAIQRGLVHWE